jgi:hypothetical protein
MKKTLRNILPVVIYFAASALYGGLPLPGVEVAVRQPPDAKPIKQIATDIKGNFMVDGLAPGKYVFVFRSAKLRQLKNEKFFIAISGAKGQTKQGTISDQALRDGVEVPIEVGRGSKIRGQVTAGEKRMIWIAPEIGSHMPGRWVDEDASGAEMAPSRNTGQISTDTFRDMQSRGTGLSGR